MRGRCPPHFHPPIMSAPACWIRQLPLGVTGRQREAFRSRSLAGGRIAWTVHLRQLSAQHLNNKVSIKDWSLSGTRNAQQSHSG